MSYARFSEGDVYVYGDVTGGITCQACALLPSDRPENLLGVESFNCATLEQMVGHLLTHKARGHDVQEALDSIADALTTPPSPTPREDAP